jgi:hypothetical protein
MKRAIAVIAFVIGAWCCGGSSTPTTPTPTPAPTPAPPTVTALSVIGCGCTSGGTCTAPANCALTATAQLSNGTTQAVTTQTQWNSTNPSVADVASNGTVTVRNAGVADITAVYQGKLGGVTVSVPPPWSQSGVGDNVFTMPTYVTRARVDATYTGFCQNFIVRISTQVTSLINVIIGTCSSADTRSPFTGTYAINNGGTVTITSSTGVNWTFTQLR